MRTARVITPFIDRVEDVYREAGDVLSLSDERAEELEAGGWVELEKKPKAKKKTKE